MFHQLALIAVPDFPLVEPGNELASMISDGREHYTGRWSDPWPGDDARAVARHRVCRVPRQRTTLYGMVGDVSSAASARAKAYAPSPALRQLNQVI
jgi:hypothetical protein